MMKKMLMIMLTGMLLLSAVSCTKEKKAQIVAAAVSLALSAPASAALQCETGMYTNVFLNGKIYNLLIKDKKKLKSAIREGARKSVAGAAACRFGINLLISSGEILKIDDTMLSADMIEDKCTTKKIKDKGTDWLLSKCGS